MLPPDSKSLSKSKSLSQSNSQSSLLLSNSFNLPSYHLIFNGFQVLRSDGLPLDPGIDCSLPILTKQEFKNDCDPNILISRYLKGEPLPTSSIQAAFIDCPDIGSFQEAFEQVSMASDLFNELPADLRNRFDNDAMRFADFASDPSNHSELVKLGLAVPRQQQGDPAPQGGQQPAPAAAPPEASKSGVPKP
jgi:hypothetical protein